MLGFALAPTTGVAQPSAAHAPGDSLAASSAPAWVPGHAIPAEEPWEQVLHAPYKLASVPFQQLGNLTEYVLGRIQFAQLQAPIPLIQFFMGAPPLGVHLSPGHLGRGAGHSAGIDLMPPAYDRLLTASFGASLDHYARARVALRHGPAGTSYLYQWRPREKFYGRGMDSDLGSLSRYAWQEQRYQVSWAFDPRARAARDPQGVLVWLALREGILRRGQVGPSVDDRFPAFASSVDGRQQYVISGVSLAHDTRQGRPHWLSGHRVELRTERFTSAGRGIRTATLDSPHFTRTDLYAEQGFSFWRDPRTLRLSGRVVTTGQKGGSGPLAIPDLVALGGHEGLESLPDGRYRDRDLVHADVHYVFPLSKHLEAVTLAEVGAVARELTDLHWGTLRESYGFTLRIRSDTKIMASAGVNWRPGAVRVHYDLLGGW
ncbi:MAG: hypothetical protein ABL977_09000 [Candidatus Eisenbacteria bacterium]